MARGGFWMKRSTDSLSWMLVLAASAATPAQRPRPEAKPAVAGSEKPSKHPANAAGALDSLNKLTTEVAPKTSHAGMEPAP